jgi:hypothetical protein
MCLTLFTVARSAWYGYQGILPEVLHGDISQQQELINHNTAKEDSDEHNGQLSHPKMAVQTQKDRSAGNYCKL